MLGRWRPDFEKCNLTVCPVRYVLNDQLCHVIIGTVGKSVHIMQCLLQTGSELVVRCLFAKSEIAGNPLDWKISIEQVCSPLTCKRLTHPPSGLELAADIASATLTNAKNGSAEIEFSPGSLKIPGNFVADSVTAGATALLLQIAFPLLLFSSSPLSSTLTLKGGTNAAQAPQIDYVENVFLSFVRRHFGIMAELRLNRRGYFPKGGGEVVVTVNPSTQSLQSFSLLDRGEVRCIKGIVTSSMATIFA